MVLTDKTILLVSPEPWGHIYVSKHHYAIHLAKRGNKVFFLNPPKGYFSVLDSEYPNLRILDYAGFWRGIRYFPKFLRTINFRLVYKRLEKYAQKKFDFVWSFDNSVFFEFKSLPINVIKLSHIVDLNMDYQFESAAKTASLCLCVSQPIQNKFLK